MLAQVLLASFAPLTAPSAPQGPLLQAELHSPTGGSDYGQEIALDGEWLAVREYNLGSHFHLYRRQGGVWSLFQSFQASGGFAPVDIEGNRLVIGNPSSQYWPVDTYAFDGTQWVPDGELEGWGNHSGQSVAIEGDRVAVGVKIDPEHHEDGWAYLYVRTPLGWVTEDIIHPDQFSGNSFGDAIDLSGDWLLVRNHDWLYCLRGCARAHLFEHNPIAANSSDMPRWVYRSSYPFAGDSIAIAIEGDLMLVGRDVRRRVGSSWQFEGTLPLGPGSSGDVREADIEEGLIAVGDSTADGVGAVYLYERLSGSWMVTAKIPSPNSPQASGFGYSVSLSGNRLATGAYYEAEWDGEAYVYVLSTDPVVYCDAKPNSQGCLPAIGFSGTASLSLPQPFLISAAQVLNSTNGILFYGFGSASIPFQGGTLCASPPVRRTALQDSGGTPPPAVDCTGTYSFDMNAYAQAGGDPIFAPGVEVSAQYWYRDPNDPAGFGTGLSDALGFVFHP